jgi:hypothetical protein
MYISGRLNIKIRKGTVCPNISSSGGMAKLTGNWQTANANRKLAHCANIFTFLERYGSLQDLLVSSTAYVTRKYAIKDPNTGIIYFEGAVSK